HLLRRIQAAETSRHGKPVVTLHCAVLGSRNGHGGNRTVRTTVLAYETMRVGEDLVAGSSVERAPFGILDARIVIERGFFCPTRIADAFCAWKGIDVRKVKVKIAWQRSELRWVRYPGVRILGGNLRQFQGRTQH